MSGNPAKGPHAPVTSAERARPTPGGLLIEAAHAAVDAPGPLNAFFRRVRSRRGAQVAIVAVARKLVVLAWHLLSGECDYRFARASLVAKKRRDLELAIGSPRRKRGARRPGPTLKERREAERAVLEEGEETYRAFVASRKTTADAAATNGARR